MARPAKAHIKYPWEDTTYISTTGVMKYCHSSGVVEVVYLLSYDDMLLLEYGDIDTAHDDDYSEGDHDDAS